MLLTNKLESMNALNMNSMNLGHLSGCVTLHEYVRIGGCINYGEVQDTCYVRRTVAKEQAKLKSTAQSYLIFFI